MQLRPGTQHAYFPRLVLGLRRVWKGLHWSSNHQPQGTCSRSPELRGCPDTGLFLRSLTLLSIPQPEDYSLQIAFLMEGNQGSWEKWLIPGLRKGTYKMNWNIVFFQKARKLPKTSRAGSHGSMSNLKGLPRAGEEVSKHQKEWKDAREPTHFENWLQNRGR